ncbi:MAG TPA: AraC family transcriptional regulator [Ktedonobacterales bacterium]|nr:AraC family transcriptional regulator [Ktedonobacterales bacterium]
MTMRSVQSSESSMGRLPTEPASLQRYRSSTEVGWDGLCAAAYHVPRESESLHSPALPELTLVLYRGGPVHVERRQEAHDPWQGGNLYQGDMVLSWGPSPASEARLWSLSAVPTQVLNLHLPRKMVSQVAEEVLGVELAQLELVDQVGIRDPLLTQVAFALWRELGQLAPAGNLYAQSAAQLLAAHLVRYYSGSQARLRAVPPPPRGLTEHQLQPLLAFIREHLSEPLSLDTLAQQVGFSPYYFVRVFRQTIGTSPHQFVRRARLERAQQLLEQTELSLAEVAAACGFADQSHLTQVFKDQLGCTPRAYRRGGASRATFQ